jgi:hypothetical protein
MRKDHAMTHRSRIVFGLFALGGGMVALCVLLVLTVAAVLTDGALGAFGWSAIFSRRELAAALLLFFSTAALFTVAARIFWRDGVRRFIHLLRYWLHVASGRG